jgi:dTDP-glucose pyrophosphorylase
LNPNNNLLIYSSATIEESILQLDSITYKGYYPALIVCDAAMKLVGTITDGDIRRYLLKNHNLNGNNIKAANLSPFFLRVGEPLNKKLLEQFKIIPIIDQDSKVIDVLTFQQPKKNTLGHVPLVINAGGRGTRLYPYTKVLPKPLIPVGENPIIDHIIESFIKYGITSITIILNYKKLLIKSYIEDVWSKLNVKYLEEKKTLGTVGGLSLLDFNPSSFPYFVLSNCDVMIEHNLESIIEYHNKNYNDITVLSVIYEDRIPYGVLEVNGDNLLSNINEKPKKSVLISAGLYVINSVLIPLIEKDTYLDMDALLQIIINKGYRVGVYPIQSEHWYDMGTIDGLNKMRERLSIHS